MSNSQHGPGEGGGKGNGGGEGERLLPVLNKADDHPCHNCMKCCNYVAVEIDEPETMKDYDEIIWYLYHGRVSVFVDWERAWFIKFDTPCDHLQPNGMCGVYQDRPEICKAFDWRECENHMTAEEGPPDKWLFETAEQFLQWLSRARPKAYKRFLRFKRKVHRSAEEPELERLTPASPADGA